MIDWVTAIIPCRHDQMIHDGFIASVKSDGIVDWQVEKKKSIRGSYESIISVKSLDPKTILIDGNPAKWLQGHNLFGSDNLIGLINAVMVKLTELLSLTPDEYDLQCWRDGLYQLKRVDCTAMWELPRRADVNAWLRAAEMQSKSRHGRPIMTGGTLYFGKNSRRWAVKFYSKGEELAAKNHKLPLDIEQCDNLINLADNKLRGELTLRSIQLKEKQLSVAAQWNEAMPLQLLMEYIGSLNMSEQFSITPVGLEGLPARLIAVYTLWKDGIDLRAMYPKASFYRYRAELLKQGVDIAIRQPSKPNNVIPLVRILRPEAIIQIPEWAIDTTLYFNPIMDLA